MNKFSFILLLGLSCSAGADAAPHEANQASATDVTLLLNAKVFTMDEARPWAQAIAIHDGKIMAIGSNEEVQQAAGETRHASVHDLAGRFVMPGFIDSHTHPGVIGLTSPAGAKADHPTTGEDDMLPDAAPDELLAWLKGYGNRHPGPILGLGIWNVEKYLPDGPNRAALDAIFPDRPVILNDNSGHSFWLNSAALNMLGINKKTPDLSKDLSMFARDKQGEPTGWVKEFAIIDQTMKPLTQDSKRIKANILEFLRFLSAHGVTTVFDAGNLSAADAVYAAVRDLDRAGELPVRYEATLHVYKPGQLKTVVADLKRLKRRYESPHLHINTVKIHLDGVTEIGTAAMLAPYAVGGGRGGLLFDAPRLARLLAELDREGMDLHVHAVGDRAVRTTLDAVETAQKTKGAALKSRVTITHIEFVDPQDLPRFAALGVYANLTPHWFGGDQSRSANAIMVGEPRASHRNMARSIVDAGAKVTFSSDVIEWDEIQRSNPFVGIQMGMTRQEYTGDAHSPVSIPADQVCDLQTMIRGYTIDGAQQLNMAEHVGALKLGYDADLMVFDGNPLETDTYKIHGLMPTAVMMGGKVFSGKLN